MDANDSDAAVSQRCLQGTLLTPGSLVGRGRRGRANFAVQIIALPPQQGLIW